MTLLTTDRANINTGVSSACSFLLQHLTTSTDGAYFASKATSRVLESALLLHLLRKHEFEELWQRRLQHHIEGSLEQADPFSRLMGGTVLQRGAGQVNRTLSSVLCNLQYGQRRKHALLKMLLVEVGAISLDDAQVDQADFGDQATHIFSKLYCAAMRRLHAKHAGRPCDPSDLEYLLKHQAENGSWEQQTLITLACMLTMSPEDVPFRRGLEFMRRTSRPDGGIPFCDNQNVWLTSLAGLALQANGVSASVLYPIGNYLASQQHENGGWSFTEDVIQTDTDDAANAVQMLIQLDPHRYASHIRRAMDFFAGLQQPNGGYPTYERMGESEATMTANVMLVKGLVAGANRSMISSIQRSISYLIANQRDDGRFEKSWSLCDTYSIFRVLWALRCCERYASAAQRQAIHTLRDRSQKWLLESQHLDGGWGQSSGMRSDALSTAYALSSLSFLPLKEKVYDRANCAAAFLLSQQAGSGEIGSIPDVAGPRPIIFEVPLLSTTFVTMALGHWKAAKGLSTVARASRILDISLPTA